MREPELKDPRLVQERKCYALAYKLQIEIDKYLYLSDQTPTGLKALKRLLNHLTDKIAGYEDNNANIANSWQDGNDYPPVG